MSAADPDVRVLVVGNPANTNAAIFAAHAHNIKPGHITAMTRLDYNRGLVQLADKLDANVGDLDGFTVWGNHSNTQFPDVSEVTLKGQKVADRLGTQWVTEEFIPKVANRGAEIIELRGLSSAASAASASVDHMRDWFAGTPGDSWVSVAFPSDGSYGIAPGLLYSFPARSVDGEWEIVQGLEISDLQRQRMDASAQELDEEINTARTASML